MNCFGVLQRFQAACTSQPNVPREISAEELAIYNDWIEEYPAKPKSIQPITRQKKHDIKKVNKAER